MTTETNEPERECKKSNIIHQSGASEAVYGLGVIGACVYFIGHATSFWMGVLGFFKGIVWPAILVYELLKYLNL